MPVDVRCKSVHLIERGEETWAIRCEKRSLHASAPFDLLTSEHKGRLVVRNDKGTPLFSKNYFWRYQPKYESDRDITGGWKIENLDA